LAQAAPAKQEYCLPASSPPAHRSPSCSGRSTMEEHGDCMICKQSALGRWIVETEFRCGACIDEHGTQPGPDCLKHLSRNDAFMQAMREETQEQKRRLQGVQPVDAAKLSAFEEHGDCKICEQRTILGKWVGQEEFRCAACIDEHGVQPGKDCLRHLSRNDAFYQGMREQLAKRALEEEAETAPPAHKAKLAPELKEDGHPGSQGLTGTA